MDGKLSLDVNRRLSIIDFSSFDDCLIDLLADSSSVTDLGNNDTFDFNGGTFEDGRTSRDKVSEQMDLLPMVVESLEPKQTKRAANCNLRKSLAWNSAFFTSEGVLDPDELAVVTKTSKKTPLPCLPGIEEDLRKSAESNSTIASESWALESLEVDLFQDLGASTGKSADEEVDKASDVSSCSSRTGQGKLAAPCGSTHKEEPSSKHRIKSATPFKKHNSSRPPLDRKSKETPSRPKMGALLIGDQKLPSKPPKSLSRIQPRTATLDQRISPTARSIRASTDNGNQQHAGILKKPVIHNSLPSSKFSPTTLPTFSSSSNQKFSSESLRKKSESKRLDQSSNSTAKTPVRFSAKKTENSKTKLAKKFNVASKFPVISPSSSIDSLSSEASSSTPTTNRVPRPKSSCVISCSNSHSEMNTSTNVSNQLMDEKNFLESSRIELLPSVQVPLRKDRFSQSSVVEAFRSKGNNNDGLQLKPSGLRLPTPKFGFFDAEKHVLRTSKVTPNNLLQSELGVGGIKLKHHGKQPSLKSTAEIGTTHPSADKKSSSAALNQLLPSSTPKTLENSKYGAKEMTDTKTHRQCSNLNIQEYSSPHALKNSVNLMNANLVDKNDNEMKDKAECIIPGEQVRLNAIVEDLDLGVLTAEKGLSPADTIKSDAFEVLKVASSFAEVLSPSKKSNLEHCSPRPGIFFNSPTKLLTVKAPLSINSSIMNKSGPCESKDGRTESAMDKTLAVLVSEKGRDLEDEKIISGSVLNNQKENDLDNSFGSLSLIQ